MYQNERGGYPASESESHVMASGSQRRKPPDWRFTEERQILKEMKSGSTPRRFREISRETSPKYKRLFWHYLNKTFDNYIADAYVTEILELNSC